MLTLVHDSVKGRTRFKISGLQRHRGLKEHLEKGLADHGGVSAAAANTVTGSLLVRYNSGMTADQLAAVVRRMVNEYRRNNFAPPAEVAPANLSRKPANRKHSAPKSTPAVVPPQSVSVDATVKTKAAAKINRPKTGNTRIDAPLPVPATNRPSTTWHAREVVAVLDAMQTPVPRGLSVEEATARLAKHGPNALPPAEPRSAWSIIVEQFKSGPVAMLAGAAAVSVLTGGIADAVAIMAVVGINAVIGYVTESQSERTIHSLKNLVTPKVLVVRDGRVVQIDVKDLVPGDLMVLRPGHYVGADARIIEATRLSIDESALTGESMPAAKSAGMLEIEQVPISDRTNMCYMGTLVTGGQGTAVVVSTGVATEMGTIQQLVTEAESPETPMSRELDRIGNQLVYLSGALCGAVFALGLFRGGGFLPMIQTALALAVAAIPEGLPTVATTTLALGIKEMRKRGVLIRHLDAVEALGATQVICLDKTGTITANRMTVAEIHAGAQRYVCERDNLLPEGSVTGGYLEREVASLLTVMVLCNESEVVRKNGGFVVNGTPTENALVYLAINNGLQIQALEETFPLLKMYHRAENRNFMASVHGADTGGHLVAVKGSPSQVLSYCTHQLIDGRKIELTDEERLHIQSENERMAGAALRVLGAAYRIQSQFDPDGEVDGILAEGLVWVGLVGMIDPIRDGVPELMARFHQAGIKTVMITGDQSATAYTVGKSLALNGSSKLNILDAASVSSMEPEMLATLSEQTNIFSRVSPAHKLQIVEAFQRGGKVVAMTGDGINDGPALKKADIGIAMGRTGTDVAREVADVVLEDDELETMIVAVRQGRTIYLNVRKALGFLLSTNFSEILVAFVANAAGLGQPLSQMQLLWINMITDIFPGLALALEPPEEDIMHRPPRDPHEPIIRKQDFRRIGVEASAISLGALGAYGFGLARYGAGPRASSMAFLSLTSGQLLHALHCRSETHGIFESRALKPNKYLNVALGGSFALQALAMVVPGLRSLLGIQPIALADAAVIGTGAVVPLLVNDVYKRARTGKERTA
ncbi:MAG: HAD-IC family P-type ATPase [Thermodesulfobacteriota bacterium]